MKLLDKIVKVIVFISIAVFMLLAIKEDDWTQGIFWLLMIFLLMTQQPIPFKKDEK